MPTVFPPARVLVRLAIVALLAPGAAAADPGPAPAAPVVLPIPDRSLVVVQVRGVDPTLKRLAAFLASAAPDASPVFQKWSAEKISALSAGRDTSAIDQKGQVFAALTSFDGLTGDTPPVVVGLPCDDYGKFKATTLTENERSTYSSVADGPDRFTAGGKTVYCVDLTSYGYVAVSLNEAAAGMFTRTLDRIPEGSLAASDSDTFSNCDVGVHVNAAVINRSYGLQLAGFRQLARFAMQPGGPAADQLSEQQLKIAALAVDGIFQSVADSRSVSVGLAFEPDGVLARVEAAFAADTPTAGVLADETPTDYPAIANLPTGHTIYSYSQFRPKVSAILNAFGQEFRANASAEDANRRVADCLVQMEKAQAAGTARAGSGPEASVTVVTPADPKAFVLAKLWAYESLTAASDYANVRLKDRPRVTFEPTKVGDYSAYEVRLKLDFETTVAGVADDNLRDTTIASMKRFVAEEPTLWIATDGKAVVEVAAANPESARAQFERATAEGDRVGNSEAFRTTLARLPRTASLVVAYDVAASLLALRGVIGDVIANLPGLPVSEVPELRPPVGGPVYVGAAVSLRPKSARLDVVVPADAVRTSRRMLAPLLDLAAEQ